MDAERGESLATNVSLIEWTYEFFQNRYGLKNVAEKKFIQFVGSVMKNRDKLPRFRLFGRFLQLFDDLSDADLKLYVDLSQSMQRTILNFQILEQDEIVLIPLVSRFTALTDLPCRVALWTTSDKRSNRD